jgi:hypothetical protein
MAKNTNKRVATKHIRDGIKSKYPEKVECAICGTKNDLEGHHYTTLSLLLKQYCMEHNIPINTDEEVLAMRDAFYEAYWFEVVEDMVCLCEEHHRLLHKTYGREPSLGTASKQKNWVIKMKHKLSGQATTVALDSADNRFSRHLSSVLEDTTNRFSRHLN